MDSLPITKTLMGFLPYVCLFSCLIKNKVTFSCIERDAHTENTYQSCLLDTNQPDSPSFFLFSFLSGKLDERDIAISQPRRLRDVYANEATATCRINFLLDSTATSHLVLDIITLKVVQSGA
jgi:hypothetical protein